MDYHAMYNEAMKAWQEVNAELVKKDKEIRKLEELLFDTIIAPNCSSCLNRMGSKICDNGIICMGNLKEGLFIEGDGNDN